MANTPSSPKNQEQLTKATAERVFGWKSLRRHKGVLVGKKQDRAGHWRKAKVPDYAGDQRFAYAIVERMKELGRLDRYLRELSRITKTKDLPAEWATPEQRCQAALKVTGERLRLIQSKKSAST